MLRIYCAFQCFKTVDSLLPQKPETFLSILDNLSKLRELVELRIDFPITIKPQFMAERAFTPNPVQLKSVKRLVLDEKCHFSFQLSDDDAEELEELMPPMDGLVWCRAIHAVFPNLEELTLCSFDD